MPGWHAAAKKWVADGKLQIIGLIQEQHPERCQLFAQWKEFEWPIVHDPINLMANSAVPIAVAIDEHGIVRSTRPRPQTFEKDFLDVKFEAPPESDASSQESLIGVSPDWKTALKKINDSSTATDLKRTADALVLWADKSNLNQTISLYQKSFKLDPKDPTLLFRLGVAYLMRYESTYRQKDDFAKAVEYWHRALTANPNQYIWRRRIQQYGPRLDKPYPFYDWVAQARKEIRERGETPIKLPVEPVGAELANRSRDFKNSTEAKNPDPENKILQDQTGLISIESVNVPHTSKSDQLSMVHVVFTPKSAVEWSNEAGPLVVWVEGKNVRQSKKLFSVINRNQLESNESRKVEFELSRDQEAKTLKGFALYYVCEKSGQCQYLRQDFEIELKAEKE